MNDLDLCLQVVPRSRQPLRYIGHHWICNQQKKWLRLGPTTDVTQRNSSP